MPHGPVFASNGTDEQMEEESWSEGGIIISERTKDAAKHNITKASHHDASASSSSTHHSTTIAFKPRCNTMACPSEKLCLEWQQKVNMTPPSKSPLEIQEVEKRMKDDGMEQYVVPDGVNPSLEQRIVYFLYGSEFSWGGQQHLRTTRIRAFLNSDTKLRMLDIIQTDSDHFGNSELHILWSEIQKIGIASGLWLLMGVTIS